MRIVAMEWDGFGSRCNEILTALLISKIVGCDFKFTWAKGSREILRHIDDQLAYFSPEFVEAHYSKSIKGPIYHLETNSGKGRTELINEMKASGFRNFKLATATNRNIPVVKDIDTKALYQILGEKIWSEDVEEIKNVTELIFNAKQVDNSIHIRSGDLLFGAWRQYPDINKYLPIGVVFTFLRKNTFNKFAIISDTFEISEVISKNFKNTISSTLFHNQANVEDPFLDVQDLFIMSLSRKVYAPSFSVFSMVGSRLGGSETSLIYENFENEDWISTFKSSLDRQTYEDFRIDTAGKMQARDIVWLIDRLWGQLTINELEDATQIAVEADDSFVLGLSQRAVLLLIAGNFSAAESNNRTALEFAQLAKHVHGDPIYYALTTSLVIRNIQTICALNFSEENITQIRNDYSKVFDQSVYQIPKGHEVDPNLRQALQIFDELVSKFHHNENIYSAIDFEKKNSFKNKVLAEFQRNIFEISDYQHFLTRLTRALIKTIEATLSKI
jgi:hypothetical protein